MKKSLCLLAFCSLFIAGCSDDNQNSSLPADSEQNQENGDKCKDSEVLCDEKCINLEEMHLSDCTTCSLNYCNSDGNMDNGCETYVLGSDMKNCGGCGIQCDTDSEVCTDGDCVPLCNDGQKICDGSCISLSEKHLESCSSCAVDYCDTNNNLADGCEAYVKTDKANCGLCGNACDNGEVCSDGECKSECGSNEITCDGKCINLSNLHLSECGTCESDYCDADNNMDNGCESNAKGSDVNNCGACGNKCDKLQVCQSGSCVTLQNTHRIITVNCKQNGLRLRSEPSTDSTELTRIPEFTYLLAQDEKNGWFKVDYNDLSGWVSGDYTMDAGDQYAGRKAIDEAEKYLYTAHPGYCTWDLLKDNIYFKDLSKNEGYNKGYNKNCANFVSTILQIVGLINNHYNTVSSLESNISGNGWKKVSFSEAKPGDIWLDDSGHTELAVGHIGNKILVIGSNNFINTNDYATYGGCQIDTGASEDQYQRVSYGYKTEGRLYSNQ